MDRRFAKFTEVIVDYYDKTKASGQLMVDTSQILAIREIPLGTQIVTEDENFDVVESFEEVRKILAI